jgi:hypothetical protein
MVRAQQRAVEPLMNEFITQEHINTLKTR